MDVNDIVDDLFQKVNDLPDFTVPAIRPIRREVSRTMAKWDPESVVAAALAVKQKSQHSGQPDLRWVAYELVHYHKPALSSLDLGRLESLSEGLDGWNVVDVFSLLLAGPAWRNGQVSDADIHGWAASEDRWWRRAALVSAVALNTRARGGRGEVARTLAVGRFLAGDGDDMVVKALSWALRTLALYDPSAVEEFLAEFEDCLAARVKREVGSKLNTGLKNPRRPAPKTTSMQQ